MIARLDTVARHRPRLFSLAYRMLGSAAQAEDIVQEAFVRWLAEPRDDVRNEAAFLTTVVTRLCLDHLKSARVQREQYPGPWLPEPLPTEGEIGDLDITLPGGLHPPADDELERLESISLAFLTLLESLSPLERAVYLLHEVFDYGHGEVAEIVGRSEAACRQIHHRAREALQARRPRSKPTVDEHRRLLESFLAACWRGDMAGLTSILSEDVVARSDGGGKANAATRELHGPRAVARLYLGLARSADALVTARIHSINGWPAIVTQRDGVLLSVIQIHTDGQHIDTVHAVVNPDKLTRVANALGLRVAR